MSALISYPDRTLAATLSGGSWQATAPLTNLSNQLMSKVARSTNALAASSIIQADLGVTAYNTRVVSICAHNISAAGTIRARGFSDAGFTTMVTGADSGTLTAWPSGFTATDVANNPKNWTFVFSSVKVARYWKIEITDTGNAAGYIEVGRCWLGDTFAPGAGVSYGMTLGYESRDVIEESLGGVPWGDMRTPRRALVAKFEVLTVTEKRAALIMQKLLTESVEAFWVSDTLAVDADMLLEAFPCYLRKPSPLSYPYFGNNEMPISVIEKI